MSHPDSSSSASDPLVEMGWRKIWWAERHMRLLRRLRDEFERTQPFAGMTIGMCIHVEPKTAVLCMVLRAGGAKLVITGSPGTTKDDVAAALRSTGVTVLGRESETSAEHLDNIREVLTHQPTLLLDNGADLVATYLEQGGQGVIAGTEETTTGANRLRADYQGAVPFPIIVINDSPLKLIMENEHGVGQASSKASCARRTCSCSRGASSSSATARSGVASRGGCVCSAGMSPSSSRPHPRARSRAGRHARPSP